MGNGSRGNDSWIVSRVASAPNPSNTRKPDSGKGLKQILEMSDLVMDSPSSSASSPKLQTEVDLPQSGQIPWYFPQLGAGTPGVLSCGDEAALNEARMDGGHSTGSFEVDPGSLSIRNSSIVQSSSNKPDGQVTVFSFPSGPEMEPAIQSDSLLALPNFGGAVSLFNATGAAMKGVGQTLITGPPAVWQGLVSRVQTTLRGSADDIGWLQKDPSLPPVVDKTERFVQLLGRISNGVHVLPDSLVYLLIPGLFSNHGPLYFVDTKKYFSNLGLACYIARIQSEAGVETNARELKEHIEELYWGTGKRVILLGHSKGGVDAAAACATYWPDLKDKVVGLVFAQSPYGGSPIASDILREGQIADFETRKVLEIIIKVIKGDIQSLEDLTYEKRRKFVASHALPIELPTVSFHTEASRAASVLSTMSHVAHAELPWLPLSGSRGSSEEPSAGAKLPVAMPLAAAMALCAIHLDIRYGVASDGLVARKDAEVPGSVVVRPEKKLDHAWMVYSPSKKAAHEPDAAQMCEALLTLLLEEDAARKTTPCNEDSSLVVEEPMVSISTTLTPSTEIQEGEEYLKNL